MSVFSCRNVLWGACLTVLAQTATGAEMLERVRDLSPAQQEWLGERIFLNECAGQVECLTAWNQGEDFPSLGIGHFIWYRAGQAEPFEETFPRFLASCREWGIALPDWLADAPAVDSPWRSREHFHAEFESERLVSLRRFLLHNKPAQVRFIVERLHASLPAIVEHFPTREQARTRAQLADLASSHPPLGLYALVDYLHFKGSGLHPGERYQGTGWGLVQVLEQLGDEPATLQAFVTAAQQVLQRRVRNAPLERGEERWLNGWEKRLRTYLPTSSVLPGPAVAEDPGP